MLLRARSPTAQGAATTLQHCRVTCAATPVLCVLPAGHPGSRAAARTAPTPHSHAAATSLLARNRPVSCSYSLTHEQCGTYTCTGYGGYDDDEDNSEDEECEDSSDDDEDGPYELHHVHTRLPLRAAALGDDGAYVLSFEDGDAAWSLLLGWDAVDRDLQNTMKYKRQITAVSLGRNQGSDTYNIPDEPGEVYFLMRNTGATYMGGGCEATLREHWWDGEGDDQVVKVCFAPSNGWYSSEAGGGASWSGLPGSLHAVLDELWDTYGAVRSLSVGHNGEWFVKFKKGCGSHGVHPTLKKLLHSKPSSRLRERTGEVQWVELGPDGTFIALFERYTAWYGSEDLTDALLAAI